MTDREDKADRRVDRIEKRADVSEVRADDSATRADSSEKKTKSFATRISIALSCVALGSSGGLYYSSQETNERIDKLDCKISKSNCK